jgi:predicted TIM-barrel fold metal-dependent hydrolase
VTATTKETAERFERVLIVSSDGHCTARMRDYSPYIDPEWVDEFSQFCDIYDRVGTSHGSERTLLNRTDPEIVDVWIKEYVENGRTSGQWDVNRRLIELDAEGISGEVLHPDFGLPFELYPPGLGAVLGHPPRSQGEIEAGNRAYNRWLVDFCSVAPERFAGIASVSFDNIEAAISQIEHAREAGLKGVMIPMFDDEKPLYLPCFDPIWSALGDMPVVSHIAISSTTKSTWNAPVPHPGVAGPLHRGRMQFHCQQILDHLIWGGVLERHPYLRVAFTEQGSFWIPGRLSAMDYTYEGSYQRRDIREVVKICPSEYFERQCWIGSSLLARSEIESREVIGVHKMMVGSDYPHFEGTWNGGTSEYLRATFGGTGISEADARALLGTNACGFYGFDRSQLRATAERIGPRVSEILEAPNEDRFPRGDVHRPFHGSLMC